jgi:hypothetical protein
MSTPAELQRTQQDLTDDDHDATVEAIKYALMHVHTALPAQVVSTNILQQTVKVQATVRRLKIDGSSVALPPCEDVPIIFPGGALTFDIASGDECLLLFSERCIDRWWNNGDVQDPDEIRFHDLSDGFALIGPNSLPKLLQDIRSGTELRLRDGSVRIALHSNGDVLVQAPGKVLLGVQSTASGAELQPPINGIVMARGIDPFSKMTYYALGATSQNVLAKS